MIDWIEEIEKVYTGIGMNFVPPDVGRTFPHVWDVTYEGIDWDFWFYRKSIATILHMREMDVQFKPWSSERRGLLRFQQRFYFSDKTDAAQFALLWNC